MQRDFRGDCERNVKKSVRARRAVLHGGAEYGKLKLAENRMPPFHLVGVEEEQEDIAMKLYFYGADRCVTGSCHCVEVNGKRILIDCGLQQGQDELDNSSLPFAPG